MVRVPEKSQLHELDLWCAAIDSSSQSMQQRDSMAGGSIKQKAAPEAKTWEQPTELFNWSGPNQ
jgi:hypothetical protein